MPDWLLQLLGVDPSTVPDGATTHVTLTHGVHSWWVFVLLAVVAALLVAVVMMYRTERAAADGAPRRALAAVRCITLLLVMLVLLGPALAVATHRTVEPYVLVLVDESLSMSIRDRYRLQESAERAAAVMRTDLTGLRQASPSRAELVNTMLEADDGRFLRDLTARGKVRVFSFARSARVRQTLASQSGAADANTPPDPAADLPQGPPVPPIQPTGQATNLARAIDQALRSVAGSPVAGIVLITDGQNTEGDDPRAAADLADSMNVPIFTLGVGEAVEPRNLRIAEMWAPDSVFRDDPFLVQAQVAAEGYDGRDIRVELVAQPVNTDGSLGAESVVATRNLSLTGGGDHRIDFEHRPEQSGDYILTVRTDLLDTEIIDTDNHRQLPLRVLSNQARVLLIAGAPSWEFRMVSTLLMRDKTVDLSGWLQTLDAEMTQAGDTVIDRLPDSPRELFDYDLVIFMDPDPSEFTVEWIDAVRQFLSEHAGGVMWVAGPKHTADFFRQARTQDMVDLLPVRVGGLSMLDIESLMMTHSQSWPLKLTAAGADHVMMRLDADAQTNRRMWESMPGVYWSFPARSAVPGASVLVEHIDPRLRTREGPRPLLVAGQYGPGRTVFMGFSGTWRWRKLGEAYFDRFWVQAVRYLVEGRLLGEQKRGRLATDREVYSIGSRVQVTARLYDADYQPLTAASVEVELRSPRALPEPFTLQAVANQAGRYEASLMASRLGLNEIMLRLDAEPGAPPVTIARQFRVEAPQVELADPRLDRTTLADLASRTRGRYLDIDQADRIAALIPDRLQTLVVPGKPIELWDTSRLLILLVALLAVEWALRKRWKMM